ncbi:MAG: tRNA lysidine(34) synthetase TilS [Planctomycetia bacterium]|nr:tRNA lysidine(34) synthetase TilS [Planctomycetia bacterium]
MGMNATYLNMVRRAGERQGWWNSDGIVAALSGGGDSVALLWLLKKCYKGRIVVAHLDHCTRNGASHEDAKFCMDLCQKWDIEYRVKIVDVAAVRVTGESFEMAGRRARYEHFYETAEKEHIDFIAVGHSADDLVETQLMNLFRGTGLDGLRGIPERRGMVVRPIIDFRRDELRDILRGNGIEWREDSSNADNDYARNRVRNELIPWVRCNLNKNFESVMIGLARQINSELSERSEETERRIAEVSFDLPPSIASWKVPPLKNLSENVIINMLRAQGGKLGLRTLSRDRTHELAALITKGGFWRFQWSGDVEVCYSDRGIGWLHRADVENALIKNKQKNLKQSLPWWAR